MIYAVMESSLDMTILEGLKNSTNCKRIKWSRRDYFVESRYQVKLAPLRDLQPFLIEVMTVKV